MSTGGPFAALGAARTAIAAGALQTAWAFGEAGDWLRIAAALRRRFAQLLLSRDDIFTLHQEWDRALAAGAWMRRHRVSPLGRYEHVWHPGIPEAFGYQYSFELMDQNTGRTVIRRGYVWSDSPMSPDDVRDQAASVVANLIAEGRHSLAGAQAADVIQPHVRIETAYRRSRY